MVPAPLHLAASLFSILNRYVGCVSLWVFSLTLLFEEVVVWKGQLLRNGYELTEQPYMSFTNAVSKTVCVSAYPEWNRGG